ncbi:MAG: phosphomethylpyrimidine synthase ThiC [Nitrososphaerota archaeon]|nr:phosphomethylpyrimidine synthase ThiC [Candidatus Bathyarchaeota archaeon]MCX8162011.1 phosphomethylpyrimidine synthase ThiC [Candidatus Bathyarchaeota archaeon]MDW8062025.1 phosphomethylpyrimidine synthase ThiC [Nitrososphaerota archaeon]
MGTIVSEAKRGVIPDLVAETARFEGVDPEKLTRMVARGVAVVPYNSSRDKKLSRPVAIGEGLSVKVNVNVGTSMDISDPYLELEKARVGLKYGADTVMDLSTGGDLDYIRRLLIRELDAPIGTVPIYQAAIESMRRYGSIIDMSEDDILDVIEKHFKDGVDFVTLHCGITYNALESLKKIRRVAGIVSRGGAFIASWMLHHDKENPLYENYDYILELARGYDVCISLGDGLRPGCIADANDLAQNMELLTVAELVERSRRMDVQCMVEGPGHMPIHQIAANVALEKALCKGAPYYLLGPVVTDIATPYDHIAAAIGSAIAGLAGADFLCVVTPSEHLGLPLPEDVKQGVIASKIAAHAVDIYRVGEKVASLDRSMGEARARLDWVTQFKLSMDPDKASEIHGRVKSRSGACTMCGDYCVYKILKRFYM